MKNFIELTDGNGKVLVNINHIVSIKELKTEKLSGCEVLLTRGNSAYKANTLTINERTTKHDIRETIIKIHTTIKYEDLRQKIIDATP